MAGANINYKCFLYACLNSDVFTYFNRDPLTFSMVHLQKASLGDLNLRVQNLVEVVRSIKRFYQVCICSLLGDRASVSSF